MFQKIKKAVLIFFALAFFVVLYWFLFVPRWNTVINNNQTWSYAFQPKQEFSLEKVQFNDEILIPANPEQFNLIFQSIFKMNAPEKIMEGIIEYNYKYSVRVLINGKECANIDRNLIQPSIGNDGQLSVYEHWRPRKIILPQDTLQKLLLSGENTISLVVYNTDANTSVELTNKSVSFLSTGDYANFSLPFKIQRPPGSFKCSYLPVFEINTSGQVIPDEPKIDARLKIIDQGNNSKNCLPDSFLFYNITIERRGNTSQSFSKKSYSFNLIDSNKSSLSAPILELPPSKKWILYGPYADKSLIRNALTYTLYREMGNDAPRYQFIDLVVNNNYQGIYLLIEKIQVGPNHLNIQPYQTDTLDNFSGGYLLEIDRNHWKSNFPLNGDTTFCPLWYEPYAPKKENLSVNATKKIQSQFNAFEESIYYNQNVPDYMDINSFVDYFIISEFSKNIDAYKLSTFIYNPDIKNEIPKFYIGPIWDYNFAYGLTTHEDGYNPNNYVYNRTGVNKVPFWWVKLLQNDIFKARLNKRYTELRNSVLSESNINAKIDSLSQICRSSADINFKRWDVLNSFDLWPNYYLGKTYDDEINYLKNWIKQRLFFMDKTLLKRN